MAGGAACSCSRFRTRYQQGRVGLVPLWRQPDAVNARMPVEVEDVLLAGVVEEDGAHASTICCSTRVFP